MLAFVQPDALTRVFLVQQPLRSVSLSNLCINSGNKLTMMHTARPRNGRCNPAVPPHTRRKRSDPAHRRPPSSNRHGLRQDRESSCAHGRAVLRAHAPAQMVLDAGRLVDFDTPQALLQKKDGLLYTLVEQSADKDQLYAAAHGKQRR